MYYAGYTDVFVKLGLAEDILTKQAFLPALRAIAAKLITGITGRGSRVTFPGSMSALGKTQSMLPVQRPSAFELAKTMAPPVKPLPQWTPPHPNYGTRPLTEVFKDTRKPTIDPTSGKLLFASYFPWF